MKALGIALIVIAVAIAVPATLTWRSDRQDASRTEAQIQRLEAECDSVVAQLGEINLRYRGYRESIPQIPDSIRAAESAIISGRMKDYNKQINALEITESQNRRQIRRHQTKRDQRAAEARRAVLPLAAATVVLLVAGALVLRRS